VLTGFTQEVKPVLLAPRVSEPMSNEGELLYGRRPALLESNTWSGINFDCRESLQAGSASRPYQTRRFAG